MAALDQMDFMMHQAEGPTLAGQVPGPGFHGLPQHAGCPYYRAQQHHHGSSLPPPHFDPGFHPMPHQLPQLSHTGHPSSAPPNRSFHSSASSGGHHPQQQQQQQQQQQTTQTQQQQSQPQPQPQPQSQTQPQPQHQPQPRQPQPQPQSQSQSPDSHSQSQPQSQLPPLQPPSLPYPQSYSHSHAHSHSHSHSHSYSHHSSYDPVHAASAAWFQGTGPVTPWPAPALHPHPHSRPSPPDSQFGGPGVVQPHLGPNQLFLPHHDQYPSFGYYYPRPAAYSRTSIVLPIPSQLSNQTGRQGQADENRPSQGNQPSRPSHPANSHSPPIIMSADRGAPPSAGRGLTLPSLNPNSTQPNQQASSNSRETSPPAAAAPANRPPPFRFPDDSMRPSNTGSRDSPSPAAPLMPQFPLPSEYPNMEHRRANGFPHFSNPPSGPDQLASPPPIPGAPGLSTRRHHYVARRIQQQSERLQQDLESDEDLGSSTDEEEQMLRYIDEFGGVNPSHFRTLMAEDHIRAAQLLRGQVSNRRVASKQALSQLQSVDPESLEETERTCVICYNDFGDMSPEGVVEAPLRLPKCQHVFGDHCIKKWFDESDSCPYCRDKVHSEPASASNLRSLHNIFRMRNRMSTGNQPMTSVDDAFLRVLAQQEQRDTARLRARQEGGSDTTTPRPFQPRERRSPPSDATETRRRTRARHSSFHPPHPTGVFGSAPASRASAGASAPRQQSPTPRERVMTPSDSPWSGLYAQNLNRLLTPYLPRQSMPGAQQLFYTPVEGSHPSNAALQHDHPSNPNSVGFRTGHPMPMQMQPHHNPTYYPTMPFGNAPTLTFSPQQQQPTGPPGRLNFQNNANTGNGAPNMGGAEGQMQ